MVRILATCLLVIAALPALAAPAYRVEPASVALGEPVTLTLTSRPGTLEKLDLAPVATDFEILGRTLGGDGKEETLVLTLYPLHSGRIALPNLGLRGRPPAVTVTEQSDTTPKLRFRIETTPETYHVRQSMRLTIEACDDGSLLWQRPQPATREGLFLRPLNEEQLDVERDGEPCTAHRWHWSVLPTVAGATVLPLPMLEAGKFGQRLRFPPPPVQLDALPVPGWLPAEAAIGRPEIAAAPLPGKWPLMRPLAWRIEVGGSYSAEALKNILRLQLANQPQFTDYVPSVEELNSDSGVPRYAVSLYALFSERGEMKLPDLVLPWYDPATGKLQQLSLPGPRVQVFDPARQRLISWMLGLAILIAALAPGYLLWRMLGWRLRRYRALTELKRAADIDDLARRLCAFSLHAGNATAATLGEWQQRMQQEVEMQGLVELVRSVEETRYGNTKTELIAMLEQARDCLASAKPKNMFGLMGK
jgi:hypothetical protein